MNVIDMDYPLGFSKNKVYYFTKDCYVYVKVPHQ